MTNLFKKNPSLFIGLALPLLMLLIFAGIPFISSYLVPAPQYNFIYSLYNTGSEGTLRVVDGKLILSIYNSQTQPLKPRQQFYLIDIVSKKSTKLNFSPSTSKDFIIPPLKSRDFMIEGISLKNIDTSDQSPDGYQIKPGENVRLLPFGLLFGESRVSYIYVSKSSHVYKIPTQDHWNVKFEGWVIPH